MEKVKVPEDLDMDKLIDLYRIDEIKGFDKDKVYIVCDCIIRQMGRLDAKGYYSSEKEMNFVPLNTDILKGLLGGNSYKGILKWMEEAGIILRDGKWETGVISQGYRFTDFFLDSTVTFKTITNFILWKKNIADYTYKEIHMNKHVVGRLQKWFSPARLTIDAEVAYHIISNDEQLEIETTKSHEKIRQIKINARGSRMKVENIVDGHYWFEQDNFGYRYHTVLTQLPRKLRSLVRYDNKPLVEVDISCSQLFFSIFLLDSRHWKTEKFKSYIPFKEELWKNVKVVKDNEINNKLITINRISSNNNSNNSNNSNNIKYTTNYSNTIMSINTPGTQASKGFQKDNFIKDCCNGLLYDTLVDQLDTQNYFAENLSQKAKRDHVKKLLLQQLFADKKNPKHKGLYITKNKAILDCFKALYPDVMNIFNYIKGCYYKDLCRLLQRIESIAVQGYVCKRLQQEYPAIPIFTLHDCLITTEGNEAVIQRIMAEEIEKYVGYVPGMKVKKWSEYDQAGEVNKFEFENAA